MSFSPHSFVVSAAKLFGQCWLSAFLTPHKRFVSFCGALPAKLGLFISFVFSNQNSAFVAGGFSNAFRIMLGAQAIASFGFSTNRANRCLGMYGHVFCSATKFEIFNSIIKRNIIYVMNYFIGIQWPSYVISHHKSVLGNVSIVGIRIGFIKNHYISLWSRKFSSLKIRICVWIQSQVNFPAFEASWVLGSFGWFAWNSAIGAWNNHSKSYSGVFIAQA